MTGDSKLKESNKSVSFLQVFPKLKDTVKRNGLKIMSWILKKDKLKLDPISICMNCITKVLKLLLFPILNFKLDIIVLRMFRTLNQYLKMKNPSKSI